MATDPQNLLGYRRGIRSLPIVYHVKPPVAPAPSYTETAARPGPGLGGSRIADAAPSASTRLADRRLRNTPLPAGHPGRLAPMPEGHWTAGGGGRHDDRAMRANIEARRRTAAAIAAVEEAARTAQLRPFTTVKHLTGTDVVGDPAVSALPPDSPVFRDSLELEHARALDQASSRLGEPPDDPRVQEEARRLVLARHGEAIKSLMITGGDLRRLGVSDGGRGTARAMRGAEEARARGWVDYAVENGLGKLSRPNYSLPAKAAGWADIARGGAAEVEPRFYRLLIEEARRKVEDAAEWARVNGQPLFAWNKERDFEPADVLAALRDYAGRLERRAAEWGREADEAHQAFAAAAQEARQELDALAEKYRGLADKIDTGGETRNVAQLQKAYEREARAVIGTFQLNKAAGEYKDAQQKAIALNALADHAAARLAWATAGEVPEHFAPATRTPPAALQQGEAGPGGMRVLSPRESAAAANYRKRYARVPFNPAARREGEAEDPTRVGLTGARAEDYVLRYGKFAGATLAQTPIEHLEWILGGALSQSEARPGHFLHGGAELPGVNESKSYASERVVIQEYVLTPEFQERKRADRAYKNKVVLEEGSVAQNETAAERLDRLSPVTRGPVWEQQRRQHEYLRRGLHRFVGPHPLAGAGGHEHQLRQELDRFLKTRLPQIEARAASLYSTAGLTPAAAEEAKARQARFVNSRLRKERDAFLRGQAGNTRNAAMQVALKAFERDRAVQLQRTADKRFGKDMDSSDPLVALKARQDARDYVRSRLKQEAGLFPLRWARDLRVERGEMTAEQSAAQYQRELSEAGLSDSNNRWVGAKIFTEDEDNTQKVARGADDARASARKADDRDKMLRVLRTLRLAGMDERLGALWQVHDTRGSLTAPLSERDNRLADVQNRVLRQAERIIHLRDREGKAPHEIAREVIPDRFDVDTIRRQTGLTTYAVNEGLRVFNVARARHDEEWRPSEQWRRGMYQLRDPDPRKNEAKFKEDQRSAGPWYMLEELNQRFQSLSGSVTPETAQRKLEEIERMRNTLLRLYHEKASGEEVSGEWGDWLTGHLEGVQRRYGLPARPGDAEEARGLLSYDAKSRLGRQYRDELNRQRGGLTREEWGDFVEGHLERNYHWTRYHGSWHEMGDDGESRLSAKIFATVKTPHGTYYSWHPDPLVRGMWNDLHELETQLRETGAGTEASAAGDHPEDRVRDNRSAVSDRMAGLAGVSSEEMLRRRAEVYGGVPPPPPTMSDRPWISLPPGAGGSQPSVPFTEELPNAAERAEHFEEEAANRQALNFRGALTPGLPAGMALSGDPIAVAYENENYASTGVDAADTDDVAAYRAARGVKPPTPPPPAAPPHP